jgi:hypothetical protein
MADLRYNKTDTQYNLLRKILGTLRGENTETISLMADFSYHPSDKEYNLLRKILGTLQASGLPSGGGDATGDAISWIGDYTEGNVLVADGTRFVSQAPLVVTAVKTSDENRAGQIVRTPDTELVIPLVAGGVYQVYAELMFRYDKNGGGGVGYTLAAPTLNTYREVLQRLTATSGTPTPAEHFVTLNTTIGTPYSPGVTGTGVRTIVRYSLFLDVGASGNLTFDWSQQVNSAGEATLLAGSKIFSIRIQ